MHRKSLLALACLLALTGAARAQIGLPGLPDIGRVTQGLPNVAENVPDVRVLAQARRLQIRDLLRAHRDVLEADASGEPIIRRQVLAVAPSPAALAAAQAAGLEVVRSDDIEGLGAMVTLRAPPGMSTRRALQRLRRADPNGIYDFDHVHLQSGAAAQSGGSDARRSARAATSVRIGLIDSGVDAEPLHGALAEQRGFAGVAAVPGAHAQTMAVLLAEGGDTRLYVADIYGGAPTGGAASTLARALTWLAQENTPVINISLVGPRNQVVAAVIAQLVRRGFLIVAAVGNDGPAAPPLYPAAYPGVVGVTGVDARERVLVEAGRGPQVDFAALGIVAGAPAQRGTSFATPIVARALASGLAAPAPAAAAQAQDRVRASARDLGARGRDETYGDGLVIGPLR